VSENPNPLLLNDRPDLRPVALLPGNGTDGNADWGGAMAGQPATAAGPDLTVYLHALRRHWLLSLGIGLPSAIVVGLAVWFIIGDKYMAYSSIHIAPQDYKVLGEGLGATNTDIYQIYKATQEQKLLSRFVVARALRNKDLVKNYLSSYDDPVDWLLKRLSVSFPGKSEMMIVSLSLSNPKAATALLAAVVNSYKTEVVDLEDSQKRARFSEIDRACVEKEGDIRAKRQELRSLSNEVGAIDRETLSQRVQHAYAQLSLLGQQMGATQGKYADVKSELEAEKKLLESVDKMEVPATDLEILIRNDPVADQLARRLSFLKMQSAQTKMATRPGAKNYVLDQVARDLDSAQQEYDQKMDELKEKARDKQRSTIEQEIVKHESYLVSMQKSKDELAEQIKQKTEEAFKLGRTSVDSDTLQADIRNLETVQAEMTKQREVMRVDLRAEPRIMIYETVEASVGTSNLMTRAAMSLMAMIAAFCCPAAVAVFWDARACRINTADDVSKRLRLPVIGSVPLIPSRVIRQLGSPSKKYDAWHLRLTASVDGIAARILHEADVRQHRAFMVSSATNGEGKTTLATQLALSLARTGRRTVLVDFDLRRPTFDEMFGLPLAPGVCEFLREQNNAADLVQESGTDNLAVVTAGQWDRQALASLSNGSAATLFNQLREEFEFVVVDSSPILPVADARFVSRHVDTVLLAVLRDVSEAPKIQAACEILAAFGVPSVEAVVTGSNNNMYGKHLGYESAVTA
jgi:polysaccharide biosynthesis transport protein